MVNIQTTGAFAAEAAFEGAYDKRVAKRENESAAKAYRQTEKTSVQEHLGDGVNITISQESQEFMAGVDERKAAQRAEKEALMEQYSANPFAYSGNAISLTNLETGERVAQEPSQWRVFSENLYKNGFYDNMSDKEVQKMEGMLGSITYGVDSISGLTDAERSYSAFSHEGAKLEFISSINALNYFADNYVPDEMRESFKNLIKAYEDYNSESVAKHKNSDDLYSEAMSKISAPNAVGVKEAVKRTQEQTAASQAIGKVTHTEAEKATVQENTSAILDVIGANAPDKVRQAWTEAEKESGVDGHITKCGLWISNDGEHAHITQVMVQTAIKWAKGEMVDEQVDLLGNSVQSAINAVNKWIYDIDHPLAGQPAKSAKEKRYVAMERTFYVAFLEKLKEIS